MADENYTFTQARTRLEEIVTQVRSKDVSLEKSLDLLEEGVRLANICTEQSDHTEWRSVIEGEDADGAEHDRETSENADQAQDSAEDAESADEDDSEATQAAESALEASESDAAASESDDRRRGDVPRRGIIR